MTATETYIVTGHGFGDGQMFLMTVRGLHADHDVEVHWSRRQSDRFVAERAVRQVTRRPVVQAFESATSTTDLVVVAADTREQLWAKALRLWKAGYLTGIERIADPDDQPDVARANPTIHTLAEV